MKNITAIVLAAGFSSRMERCKLDLPFKNHTIIEEVLLQLSKIAVTEILVVTGHYKDRLENLLSGNKGITITHNTHYAKGMTTSIQCGVKKASINSDGYLICLGDLPLISSEGYKIVLDAVKSSIHPRQLIVRPFHREIPGHPVFFGADFKDDILDLKEAEGAKSLFKSHSNFVQKLKINSASIIKDFDTPNQYNKYNG